MGSWGRRLCSRRSTLAAIRADLGQTDSEARSYALGSRWFSVHGSSESTGISVHARKRTMEEVVIVGGGPVGFINALGLAQAAPRGAGSV
jgi:hypothetical protein